MNKQTPTVNFAGSCKFVELKDCDMVLSWLDCNAWDCGIPRSLELEPKRRSNWNFYDSILLPKSKL